MLNIFKKQREFIVEEKDVTTVLNVVNREMWTFDYRIGNCGWADETTKWFIIFDMNDKHYGNVINDLNDIGAFRLSIRPSGQVDLYYEVKS